jgi:hypothetical protein
MKVVVIHQAKGVEQPALLLDLFGQQINEAQAILIVEKDRLGTRGEVDGPLRNLRLTKL